MQFQDIFLNEFERLKLNETVCTIEEALSEIESFEVIGDPNVNVVAFTSRTISISNIIDALEKKHWNLNILQNPLCLHICITPNNIDNLREFVEILRELTLYNLDENTNDSNLVAIYGMAAKIPDKNIVDEIVEEYLDYTTDL